MATTGAERARTGTALALLVLATIGSCVRPAGGPGGPTPAAETRAAPMFDIGLAVGAANATIGGEAALVLAESGGRILGDIPAGAEWKVAPRPSGLRFTAPGGLRIDGSDSVTLDAADSTGLVRVNGRAYHGRVAVLRDRTGITIVNRVELETYLVSVVSSEMGRRDAGELTALEAQAIVSRTYALRNQNRWRASGFDLYGTVADQVYGGVAAETELGRSAVEATRGQVATYNGELIDAFFFSTCGGRTAEGTEIFRNASRPYLRSISDTGPNGEPYCSISPRFRWQETWSGEALRTTLRRTLPTVASVPTSAVSDVRDVRVGSVTGSGRVGALVIALRDREVRIDAPQVRQVLRTASGEILRSNAFTLTRSVGKSGVTQLVVDGGGSGHGVGLCQWGAIGRSRAGQSAAEIIRAYYPGTEITRSY